jgi:multiple sugar transport system ATP-binding protein
VTAADIELRGVTKRYPDGALAVDRLDLRIVPGEFMILVGPSGCGKTTALRMVAGLEDITDGHLRIDGEVVNDRAPKDRDIAMVFQNYALYPQMTVRENMGFALKLAKIGRREIERRVLDAARTLDLQPHLDRKPAMLSGGQRQRVAMGRAIVRDPKAFLMDEPLSNLDAKLRVQMRTEIARMQHRVGTTTLYVTHDQTEAMTLGDRVAIMRNGVIQQLDTPQRLYDDPVNVFVAGFIGSPPMNLLPATLEDDAVQLPLGRVHLTPEMRARLSPGASRGPVLAGLRPEAFDDATLAPERPDAVRFRARVELVESMGAELYVYFDAAGEQVVARVEAGSRIAPGDAADLVVRTAGLRLFDADSGNSLLASD